MTREHNARPDIHRQHAEPLAVQAQQIPRELLHYPQWVCWRYVERGESKKPDKRPVNPWTLHNAGVHWPNTWSTFEHAFMTYTLYAKQDISGIGFVLTRHDPFVGIDIDRCLVEGSMAPVAQAVAQELGSYTEVSPSGQGLRMLVSCEEYRENRRTQTLEIYSHSRFLTLTGAHLEGTPRGISLATKDTLLALSGGTVREPTPLSAPPDANIPNQLEGLQLWAHIFAHDKYGPQHAKRFQGDTSLDRNDHSFTVIRLLNTLARWTNGDTRKMREMILMSSLRNEKWFTKRGTGDWLDYQIADAIAFVKGER